MSSPMRKGEANQNQAAKPQDRHSLLRAIGLGFITGAADDDPLAIGTYSPVANWYAFCSI